MRVIGARALKESLSETLRAVARGEQVRVTVRGRPVADIVPAGTADSEVRQLVSDGRLTPPAKALPTRAPRLAEGSRSASGLLIAEREAER